MSACPFAVVRCPHEAMGCSIKVTRSGLAAHLGGCPFQACQSFMASTLSRLQAIEADNRQLRSELVTLRTSVRWLETTQPVQCADCDDMFVPPEPASSPKEPSAEAGNDSPLPKGASGAPAGGEHTAAPVSRRAEAAEPKTMFRPWPPYRTPHGAAFTFGAMAAHDAFRGDVRMGCTRPACKRHRRDEDWYTEWRRRKCRYLLAASTPSQAPFLKMSL
jgi:hypothetical protein